MGQKDIVEKNLLDYGDVFADIVNVLLFNGEEVVKPDEIMATTLRSMYKADNTELHEMERDVAKIWTRGGIKLALYGLENQTLQDEYMPLRIFGYDGQSYRSQLISEKDGTGEVLPVEPYPVVTLVLYFGSTPWTKPKTLYECFDVPENLRPFVNDFKINLFEIAYLTKEQVEMFKSDFRIVADYFVQMRTNKKFVPSKKVIEHVDGLLKFMSIFTGDIRYETVRTEVKGGTVTMCDFLEAAIQEGIAQGIERGVEQEIFKSVFEQDYSLARGAQKLGCTEEEFLRRYVEAGYEVPSTKKSDVEGGSTMESFITCTDGLKAFVGDRVRVVGKPERFFFDTKIKDIGVIREIGWYDDDTYYGFVLDNTNKFYVVNCDEIALVD